MYYQYTEDVESYASKRFDILVELTSKAYRTYQLTVIDNKTKQALELVDNVSRNDIGVIREQLKFKYLISLK